MAEAEKAAAVMAAAEEAAAEKGFFHHSFDLPVLDGKTILEALREVPLLQLINLRK